MRAWPPRPSTFPGTARWSRIRTWRCPSIGAVTYDLDDDLMPYRRLIANGLPAVMAAHVLFPAVDPDAGQSVAALGQGRPARRAAVSRVWCSPTICRWVAPRRRVTSSRAPARARGGLRHAARLQRSPRRRLSARRIQGCGNAAGFRLRLVRMRGRAGMPRDDLCASAAWQRRRGAARALRGRPTLKLEAGAGHERLVCRRSGVVSSKSARRRGRLRRAGAGYARWCT